MERLAGKGQCLSFSQGCPSLPHPTIPKQAKSNLNFLEGILLAREDNE
jgi:hypothetical protein